MRKLLIQFARFGPYHHARLRAAHEALTPKGWEVIGLEIAGSDATYAWDETKGSEAGPRLVTAFPGLVHEELSAEDYRTELLPLLDSLEPDVVAIAGWGNEDARTCLSWCRRHKVRSLVMSETREADGRRVWWKERLKGHLIRRFEGALVGGRSHRDYLIKLGLPPERIAFGYNVVDNAYFASEALNHRSTKRPALARIFLASNRFIERKNLTRLIDAYALFCESLKRRSPEAPAWQLCLLGDGERRHKLISQALELGLRVREAAPWDLDGKTETSKQRDIVFFPGFRQIDELPRFYAHAGAFVHPALEEPWGLVLNEAMACGLPVLSSRNVGAAEELVEEGVNGWTFDAVRVEDMASALEKLANLEPERLAALGEASRRLLEERCPTCAFGEGLAELLQENGNFTSGE